MEQPHGIIAIFHRKEGFYPIQFMGNEPPEIEAAKHAELNAGTLMIEDIEGNVLWKESEREKANG